MSTLLMRLAGPMQSWGTQSRFTIRDTEREPSKSGIVGLICAALGRPHTAAVTDLAGLRMGVRVDREGTLSVDYHTAGGGSVRGIARADGGHGATVVSSRYFLADADFLVGLEGDDALLGQIDQALADPHWQLCLGRKAMVPGVPIRLPDDPPRGPGLRHESLGDALATYPLFAADRRRGEPATKECRLILDAAPTSSAEVRRDVPLSFAARTFGIRYVLTTTATPPWRTEE